MSLRIISLTSWSGAFLLYAVMDYGSSGGVGGLFAGPRLSPQKDFVTRGRFGCDDEFENRID